MDLNDPALIALVDRLGSARLVRLSREAPAAVPIVQSALRAAEAAATSPERLERLVAALSDDRETAVAAIGELRHTGSAGVGFCIARITETDDPQVRARLREALVALDPISRPAVFAAATSEDTALQAEAAYALGRLAELERLSTPLAAALVAGPALSSDDEDAANASRWAYSELTGRPLTLSQARSLINGSIDELLAGSLPFIPDGDGMIAWPPYPAEERQPRLPGDVAKQLAAGLAASLTALDPGDSRARRLALLMALETGGSDGVDELPTHYLSDVLSEALDRGFYQAASACCEALGERGDLAALATSGGRPAPLSRALMAPHPLTRFAAVQAILAVNSQEPFPGSSAVRDTLAYFASATGQRRAVVAMPQLARAGEIAGWLNGVGYRATPVNQGVDVVRLASESPDTELVVLDLGVIRPNARETLFRLRRTPTTALTPVVLLAADGRLADALRIAEEHGGETGRVLAIARPHSADSVAGLVNRTAAITPADWPDATTRTSQAAEAREAIAQLLENGPSYLGVRELAGRLISTTYEADSAALSTLLGLGTPESQRRLLDTASLEARPLEQRQAAAEAFAQSVARHGVLLTTAQIRQQYDRYNASSTAPAATQQVLGRLLDMIEGARTP